MYRFIFFIFFVSLMACHTKEQKDITQQKKEINTFLNNWHKAAATSNFIAYFSAMDDDAIFIGTDATENWHKTEFKTFAKPYFDAHKAWNFKPLERHVFMNKNTAWFDELLDTHMGICRGSGVLKYKNKQWKIKHYVLSISIPNDNVDEVVLLKKQRDSVIKSQVIHNNN